MSKIAVVTDSNSGMTKKENIQDLFIIPMPFIINDDIFYEGVNLTQVDFFDYLESNADVSTSQASPSSIMDLWDEILKEYDEIVHIPMSSGLSGSCESAMGLALEYDGKVQVVDNQRISVTLRHSVMDALELAKQGKSAKEIKDILEKDKYNSSIYIMLDTLYYLKKGGRITSAAAAIGTLVHIKPILQIQGEKLDAYAKTRTSAKGKTIMLDALEKDMTSRFLENHNNGKMILDIAHTNNWDEAMKLKAEMQSLYPQYVINVEELPLSIACHTGPGALGVACTCQMNYEQ